MHSYEDALLVPRLLRRDDDDCTRFPAGKNGYVPMTNCNSYYNSEPQFAPAVSVAVIFGILTLAHLSEGILYKKRFTWVLIMGGTWETVAFILHALGSKDQLQVGYATSWNILFLLAPLWINAFVYMTFARMAWFFLPQGSRKIWGIEAASVAKYFVMADVFTFIVQGVGGIMASPGASADVIKVGLNVYMSGLGCQQLFILVFVGLMVQFHRRCSSWGPGGAAEHAAGVGPWQPLLIALYTVLTAVTVRIIYRMNEFARGINPAANPIPYHEAYSYALDCFPMMVALLVLAVWHPGRFLVGPDSELPSRKQKRAEKRARKAAKKATKLDKQMADASSTEMLILNSRES